jgi:tetratricopeptide (TPR) repeat protein
MKLIGKVVAAKIISRIRKYLRKYLGGASGLAESNSLDLLRSLSSQMNWFALESKGREVISKYPLQDEAFALLAYSLQQQGRLEEAVTFAVQALAISDSRWLSYYIAGVALKGLGRVKDACEYLRKAVAIDPGRSQGMKALIEAIGATDGIELAASEYAAYCRRTRCRADLAIANVRTVRDWAQNIGLRLKEAGEAEEIPFESPHVWRSVSEIQTHVAISNKPYVADISDARIFSHSSLILTSDGTILSDTGGHPRFGRYVSFVYDAAVLAQEPGKVLLDFSKYTTREIEAGILLSGLASNAFGHWIPEFLPKLQFLKEHPDFEKLPIIVDADMPQSHFEHLQRLSNNALIRLQANESFICRRLLVAPSPAFSPVELFPNDIPVHEMPGLSPRALLFIRGDQSIEKAKIRARRIFLARKNTKWRRLLNEQEIAADLANVGFETIVAEEMKASEQIDLFQSAQWIVAPNGSALLNLVFADPGVKLLILSQPNLFNWGTFQGPMLALGYKPIWVRGETAVALNQKHSDYVVPIESLRKVLAEMGLEGE